MAASPREAHAGIGELAEGIDGVRVWGSGRHGASCGRQAESGTPAIPRRLRSRHRAPSAIFNADRFRYPERVHAAQGPLPLTIRSGHDGCDEPTVAQAVPASLTAVLPSQRHSSAHNRIAYGLQTCSPLNSSREPVLDHDLI